MQKNTEPDRVASSPKVSKKGQSSPKGHGLFGKRSQSPKGGPGSPKKLAGRKGSTSSQKGAISALCASAMQVEVGEEPQPGSVQRESPDGARSRDASVERKKKNKFLDGNWLQKPKKFFKASKYVLLDQFGCHASKSGA